MHFDVRRVIGYFMEFIMEEFVWAFRGIHGGGKEQVVVFMSWCEGVSFMWVLWGSKFIFRWFVVLIMYFC